MTLNGRVDCLRKLLVTRSSVPGLHHNGSLGSPNCHGQYRPELLGRLHRGKEALRIASTHFADALPQLARATDAVTIVRRRIMLKAWI